MMKCLCDENRAEIKRIDLVGFWQELLFCTLQITLYNRFKPYFI